MRKREKERVSQPEFHDRFQVRRWILVLKIGYETRILLYFLMAVIMFGGGFVPNSGGLISEAVVSTIDVDGGGLVPRSVLPTLMVLLSTIVLLNVYGGYLDFGELEVPLVMILDENAGGLRTSHYMLSLDRKLCNGFEKSLIWNISPPPLSSSFWPLSSVNDFGARHLEGGKINSIDFHGKDDILVTASEDDSVRLYDIANAKIRLLALKTCSDATVDTGVVRLSRAIMNNIRKRSVLLFHHCKMSSLSSSITKFASKYFTSFVDGCVEDDLAVFFFFFKKLHDDLFGPELVVDDEVPCSF
ncbi:hypothetical protein L484_016647 [Morus notabilis]|uniref:Uncharacterized protein n=1 Tax=Morus notabilis TaxID=981085 RepID=W9RM04_9ROSA|nr:hypothetical protein L484_016647 [Morus notabilis]